MNTKFNGPSELMVTRNSSVNRFEVTIEGRTGAAIGAIEHLA